MATNRTRQLTAADLCALTVRQPFAWKIMTGEKTIEYRSWDTDYRGAMLIHVSSKVKLTRAEAARWPAADVYSVILGSVILDHIEGQPGNYEWHLRDPRPLAVPISCVGQLKLWKPPEAVLKAFPKLAALVAAAPPHPVQVPASAKGSQRSPAGPEILGYDFHCDHCNKRHIPCTKDAKKGLCPKCGKLSDIED